VSAGLSLQQAHLNPWLVVQVADVKLAARGVWEVLVMLLQDLVKSHVVEIHVLLQLQELVANGMGRLHGKLERGLRVDDKKRAFSAAGLT